MMKVKREELLGTLRDAAVGEAVEITRTIHEQYDANDGLLLDRSIDTVTKHVAPSVQAAIFLLEEGAYD